MKNAFLVYIPSKDKEQFFELRTSDGYEHPPEVGAVVDIVVASTPAQAKYYFLNVWAGQRNTGVYHDDWVNLRVRLLLKDVKDKKGIIDYKSEIYDDAWGRVHEVVDHNNAPCDCIDTLDEEWEKISSND